MIVTDIPAQYKLTGKDGTAERGWLQWLCKVAEAIKGTWTRDGFTPYGMMYSAKVVSGQVVDLPCAMYGNLILSYDSQFINIRVDGNSFTVPTVTATNAIICSGVLKC